MQSRTSSSNFLSEKQDIAQPWKEAHDMKDKNYVWNPFRILSPKLNSEITKSDETEDVDELTSKSPEEILVIMVSKLIELTKMISLGFQSESSQQHETCEKLIQEIGRLERASTSGILKVSETFGQNVFKTVVRLPSRVERIGVMFEHILACQKIKVKEGILFSDKAQSELMDMLGLTVDLLRNVGDSLVTCNLVILDHIKSQSNKLAEMAEENRLNHWERMERGFCSPDASAIYLKILDSFKGIAEYAVKISDSLCSLEDVSK
jgi:phosphate:Na+ symporter